MKHRKSDGPRIKLCIILDNTDLRVEMPPLQTTNRFHLLRKSSIRADQSVYMPTETDLNFSFFNFFLNKFLALCEIEINGATYGSTFK